MAAYDLVIKGGTVIDGLRTPRFKADVTIAGGKVVQIGRVSASDGTQVADAPFASWSGVSSAARG